MKTGLVLAALLSVCSGAAFADPLRLGMTPEPYMPATMIDSSGKWIGYEADISHDICAAIPDGCEIRQMAWDALIPSLQADKVDFIVGAFSITDERLKVVDFSIPYEIPTTHLVGPKADKTEIKATKTAEGVSALSPEGLESKIVGAQGASIQSNYMAQFVPSVEVKNYNTADNVVADLIAGRVDYVLLGDGYIEKFLTTPEGADYEIKLTLPNSPALGNGIGYAVRKGDVETLALINAPIQAMTDDGRLKTYIDKWTAWKE